MIALVESYQAGLLKPKNFLPNLLSGIVVGIVALPLAMAFAIASGARPEQGIYTAIIAGIVVAIFGGSRVQIAGPTGAFIIILSTITAKYGVHGLQLATLIAGFILLGMGFAKLGNVIKFIPHPVIVGFTSAIGIIIFVSQLNNFFGISIKSKSISHFHETLIHLFESLPHINKTTTALGLLSLWLMIVTPKLEKIKKIPAPLIAMIVVTIIQGIFQFSGVATIGSTFGAIPQKLPHFQIPHITYSHFVELIGPAFAIAMLGSIESLLSAVVADGMAGTRHHSNQELIGQGLANILCPLFGGFAATGAIARTATNIRHGGNSPLAAIVHSIFLIFVILFLAPLTVHIPLCTLAAILFVVAYNMSEVHHFLYILKNAPKYDSSVLIITFLLTLFTDLVIAVNIGIILSILLFVRRMSQSVHIDLQTEESLQAELSHCGISSLPKDIFIYSIQGPFFFGAAEVLQQALHSINEEPKKIVFRLKYVPFMDITGIKIFKDIIKTYKKNNIPVYICEANAKVSDKLLKADFLPLITGEKLFLECGQLIKEIVKEES